MKEYVVLEIQCKKELNFLDIYFVLKSNVSYNSNLFALQNLDFEKLNSKACAIYDRLQLCKYEYKIVLEHLVNTPYYNPELHDRRMVSNMDSCWSWYNEQVNESLSDNDFKDLITFCDLLRAQDVLTCVVGFDQIEWDGTTVGKGMYGFEKADCTYGLGKNYLSNALVIGRTHENKQFTAFLSCEKRFRNLGIIDKIVRFLGEKKYEEVYFAPENEAEREEWIEKKENAKLKFQNAMEGVQSLPLEKFERILPADRSKKKNNVQNYIRKFLCTDGWLVRPARSYEHSSVIYRNKDDSEIAFSIVSGHNGQHLQALVYYRSNKFLFSENLHDLYVWSSSEQDIEKFFRNMIRVRDYFYECL